MLSLSCFKSCIALLLCVAPIATHAQAPPSTRPAGVLDHVVKDIDGKDVDLSTFKGKAVLIVNVASKCGFTRQYAGLEKLYTERKDAGLVVIGFPANNFNGQEPGTDQEIKQFCSVTYGVTFPMMSKISVKGEDKAPLYRFLTEPETAGQYAGEITWNFNKLLVDREGKVIARFPSNVAPDSSELLAAIDKAIGK